MVILMQSLDAGRAPRTGALCRPKELTALAEVLLAESLAGFEEANGKRLGVWSPGFPELQVHQDSTLHGSDVQCSLLFMARGLEEILEDQRDDLNPTDVPLHQQLKNAIATVNMLAACAKHILGGECSPEPPPPSMPRSAFDRKQWSHTLLKTAGGYLGWLERMFGDQMSKVKGQNKRVQQPHPSPSLEDNQGRTERPLKCITSCSRPHPPLPSPSNQLRLTRKSTEEPSR